MMKMAWILWVFLFLFTLFPLHSSQQPLHLRSMCLPHQSSALLSFKNSFQITKSHTFFSNCDFESSNNKSFESWNIRKDCCDWSGVTCDNVTRRVVELLLPCRGLSGVIDSNNSLFSLTHLRALDLSGNYFEGSSISPNFGRFPNLTFLDLSSSFFSGYIPLELSYLSNKLLTLNLGSLNNRLRAETTSLKKIIANLTSLTELRLDFIDMFDVLPISFMNLSTSIMEMDLSFCRLKGQFPKNILNLPKLEFFSLAHNYDLTGSIPQSNWTSLLKELDLSDTEFPIDISYLTQSLTFLDVLSIGNCSDIESNHLGGQIPWDSLDQLTDLDLSFNSFDGQLPEICSNSSFSSSKNIFLCHSSNHQLLGPLPLKLEVLIIENNFLDGKIPSWLYSLPNLRTLNLRNNYFTGHIGQFYKNSSLENLNLGSNLLHGAIPQSLFQLKNLQRLYLSSNNLSGVVMLEQFSEFNNLITLDLSYNSLSVISIPRINYTLPRTLSYVALSSCNISEFPKSLEILKCLVVLDLSNNRIQGSIPNWLWKGDSLYSLNLSYNLFTNMSPLPSLSFKYINLKSNRLQGNLPILPHSTVAFFASDNQFSGGISSVICNQSLLKVLDLANNNLSGNILPCLGNFSNTLSILDLRMNSFDGTVPSAFSQGSNLRTLSLNRNRLEGALPRTLVNAENLEVLDLGNNKLNGSFPQFLESLQELRVLVLRSNRFRGAINNPKIKLPFQSLRIMDLSDNEFTGALPVKYLENFKAMIGARTDRLEYLEYKNESVRSFYQNSATVSMKGINIGLERIQTMLIVIDFSRNGFTGRIPKLVGKLASIKGISFSGNKLSGPIPSSLGNLSNLEWLDLSSNKLDGKIPKQLASNLKQLAFLNLSGNKLEGKIPRGSQFDTFTNDSFGGNLGLCGFPLAELCGDSGVDKKVHDGNDQSGDETFNWKLAAAMGYGAGLVIGVSIGYIVFFTRRLEGVEVWKQINRLRRLRTYDDS